MKQAILLAAYGATGVQNQISLKLFEDKVREEFPGISIRWAFTSLHMRNRLAVERKKSDSVEKALYRLAFEKFTQVAVQSLHVIPGREYQDMLREIAAFKKRAGRVGAAGPKDAALADISVGLPLLNNIEDLQQTAQAIYASAPPERKPEDYILWVGHGSQHAGQVSYKLLAAELCKLDSNMLIGTLDNGVQEVLPFLGVAENRTVWLLPLLSVVGKHAREDLVSSNYSGRSGNADSLIRAGHSAFANTLSTSGRQSWQSQLEACGFICRPVLRGMIEYPAFTRLWVRHLKESAFKSVLS